MNVDKYLEKNDIKLPAKKIKILKQLVKKNKARKWKTYKITLHREIKGQSRPRTSGSRIYDPDSKYKEALAEDIINELCESYDTIKYKIKKKFRMIDTGKTRTTIDKYKREKVKPIKRRITVELKKVKKKSKLKNEIKVVINHYRKFPYGTNAITKVLMGLKVIRPQAVPDLDNIAKLILDTLNEDFITDDKIIISLKINTFYAEEHRCVLKLKHRRKAYIPYKVGIENEI